LVPEQTGLLAALGQLLPPHRLYLELTAFAHIGLAGILA
jgi:hypothetical protein